MRPLTVFLLSLALAAELSADTLTFEQAVALAAARSNASQQQPLLPDPSELRRSRLPSVRAEVAGNASRTLDLFSEGPYEVRYSTSVLAFDYPLWDGGATSARIAALEERVRRAGSGRNLDDARFAQLLDAFGELYLAQRQEEVVRPIYEQLAANADSAGELLASGELSNLMATERRELALNFASRLLDLEARRVDAAGKLRLLTGIDEEPRLQLELEQTAPDHPAADATDDSVDALTIAVEESRARLREVKLATGFRAMLSGFVGFGAAESEFSNLRSYGAFGVYGLRVNLSYPLFGGAHRLPIAEAQVELARIVAMRDAAIDAARARASEYQVRIETAGKRIALLKESVERSKEREESLHRLVLGGIRPEADLAHAQAERSRRESDLLAAAIDRWKAAQLLARMNAERDQP